MELMCHVILPSTTAGTDSSALAAKRHQMFMVEILAAHAQEIALQATTL